MHVRSILWSDRLVIFIPYVSLAHQATDWFVQGEEVPSSEHALCKDFDILDDGSQPEFDSILL